MTAPVSERIAVGRVLRPWGRQGAAIVEPLTHDPDRFLELETVWVALGESATDARVASVRFDRRGRPLMSFSGYDSIDDAERLRGARLEVAEQHAVRPPGDAFFDHELVGCNVELLDGTAVGTVRGIQDTEGASLLMVDAVGGEVLVPLTRAIVHAVDVDAHRIVVDPPVGLIELNRVEVDSAN